MKRLFILLLAVYHLAPIEPAVALKSGEPTDLRGYGKVSAGFSDNQAVFQCVDAPHADILLGKLLADLFWDAGSDHIQRSLNVGGVAVAVHAWAPYGVLAVGRIGSQVVALGAADDETLRALLGNHPEFLKGSPVFVPEKPYPRYLDHYDLRAFKSYVHPMTSQRNLGLDSHWPFVKKFGLGGIGFQSVTIFDQSPAPGVANFASSDYEFRVANQQDGVISIGLGAGGEVPLWIYNLMPDDMMQPSPTTQFGAWNGFGPTGAHFESWWIPAERRASGSLSFMRQAMGPSRDPGYQCVFWRRRSVVRTAQRWLAMGIRPRWHPESAIEG